MIDINKLNEIKRNNSEIEVWGFEKCYNNYQSSSINFNAITYPLIVQNAGFNIKSYYADGFIIDDKTQIILPILREDNFREFSNDKLKRTYGASYYPLHEFYLIPKPFVVDMNQEYYDKLNEELDILEKTVNDFFLTREEITNAVKYITKSFYKKDYFIANSQQKGFHKYDLL